MGEFMIEIIALAAAAALVPAIAAFTWIVKKRLDDLQDEVFALTDDVRSLAYKFTLSQNQEPKEITEARIKNLMTDFERAILRKAGEE
jgi:2,4-dienoyl-CoA reductase-like NADH-dependent reductase (Old Yellow Enzyme family)